MDANKRSVPSVSLNVQDTNYGSLNNEHRSMGMEDEDVQSRSDRFSSATFVNLIFDRVDHHFSNAITIDLCSNCFGLRLQ